MSIVSRIRNFRQRLNRLQSSIDKSHEVVHADFAEVSLRLDEQNRRIDWQADRLDRQVKANADRQINRIDRAQRALEQTVNQIACEHTLQGPVLHVLFLIHNVAALSVYYELILRMQSDPSFTVTVASLDKHFPGDRDFSGEEQVHRRLVALQVSHIRLSFNDSYDGLDLVKSLAPDIIFRQAQWEPDIPEAFQTQHLRFSRLCYIPYHIYPYVEVPGKHDSSGDGVWDGYFQRSQWMYFCPSALMKQAAEDEVVSTGGSNFIVTGHPKVSHIREAEPHWPLLAREGTTRHKVLWDAHHTVGNDWFCFGLFPRIADDMLAWAQQQSDTDIVFTPHPALLPNMQAGASDWDDKRLAQWLNEWNALSNTALVQNSDYARIYQASDLLISDGISSLAEYQITEKPVVFLERPDHAPWNSIGKVSVTGTNPVGTVDEAKALVNALLSGSPDPHAEAQTRVVHTLFPEIDAVSAIVDELKKGAAAARRN